MYQDEIKKYSPLTIEDIIAIAENDIPQEFRGRAYSYVDERGRGLDHGTAILDTEELCSAYTAAYGRMHRHKLYHALDERLSHFPYSEFRDGVEIFDWGCGQGIGTMAVIEHLRQRGMLSCLRKITLEEPSDVARRRAILHVQQALGGHNVIIEDTAQFLPSDDGVSNAITQIDVSQACALHIFSNILDIKEVSLKKTSKLIASSGQKHISICIGPIYSNGLRINDFIGYFKNHSINVFTDYYNTNFGKHPNGRHYGCLVKSFIFHLSSPESVLCKFPYFAPIHLCALYTDNIPEQKNSYLGAFDLMAPFDMTACRTLHPVFALISNLISRGIPTYASAKVIAALSALDRGTREKSFAAIARIQKTLIEVMMTARLSIELKEWKVVIIERETSVAQLAINDFVELYHHLVAMTEAYETMPLPTMTIVNPNDAKAEDLYDLVIDVSIDRFSDPEALVFPKYRAKNDCCFIVRSSYHKDDSRYFYTTERIKYKRFVEKDAQGRYVEDDALTSHLRYFLNLIFRKEDFRPGQLPILSRAMTLKSVIGLLPTGGGKSLTYQLAALLQPGVTLVVDPLKGLMKNQLDGLLRVGIDAVSFINSDLETAEREKREQQLTQSKIQIMFLSPERLSIRRFRETLRSMREAEVFFAYGVVDEVHCVSEWGHDFRLAYLHLGRNLYNYVLPKEVEGENNHISLFGLTATASFDVLADVERELSGMKAYSLEEDATVRYENTNRLELQYVVIPADASEIKKAWDVGALKEDMVLNALSEATLKIAEIQSEDSLQRIRKRFIERENITDSEKVKEIYQTELSVNVEGDWLTASNSKSAGIVFCLRANPNSTLSPDSVASKLRQKGISRLSTYKGGDNTLHQDKFLRGESNLMVATKAFGMGIDKPNVRITIHLNYPSSLESFVQEAGRAGRDRRMALAAIVYSPKKFQQKNVRSNEWAEFSADYINNKHFYDSNFLGAEFELFVMQLLMYNLKVVISNEEMQNVQQIVKTNNVGIVKFIKSYPKGTVLTYYVNYREDEAELDAINRELEMHHLPVFDTLKTKLEGRSYTKEYGKTVYKDAIQKAIYRMCVIGLIDDFTEDYGEKNFRITTVCQNDSEYIENLRLYYRKYYSAERVEEMIAEVWRLSHTDGVIMACLKHLTNFIYKSIAEKRARGILDMEQFCNSAINSSEDWKVVNENLKDFIYYYFNSKYARERFVTYDASIGTDIPFSLKDDTNTDVHTHREITDFVLVEKYMRVVDPEIVNNDSQKDNVKHLQGAIRLIRRAAPEMNPVLNLLNIFCILFLEQQDNEMLEEEILDNYGEVWDYYSRKGTIHLLDKFKELLELHGAIKPGNRDYFTKLEYAIRLREHYNILSEITKNYLK